MKNLAQKMTDIMKTVKTVKKGEKINITNSRSYTAVGHDDVAALLHDPLASHGVWVKVSVTDCQITASEKYFSNGNKGAEYRADVWTEVTFINADDVNDRETVKSFAYAFDSSDKAVGKAESMAVKYALLKNFTLESIDEEESRDHEHKYQSPQKRPASEKQIELIKALCNQTGQTFPTVADSDHASRIIERLNQLKKGNQ